MIEPEMERLVVELLDCSAVQKIEENRPAELTFADACRFWGVTENTKADQIGERISWVVKNLIELNRIHTATAVLPVSGRVLTPDQIRMLLSTFFHLEKRFERHLNLLRGGRDNR